LEAWLTWEEYFGGKITMRAATWILGKQNLRLRGEWNCPSRVLTSAVDTGRDEPLVDNTVELDTKLIICVIK
jgi:hypothetical protein